MLEEFAFIVKFWQDGTYAGVRATIVRYFDGRVEELEFDHPFKLLAIEAILRERRGIFRRVVRYRDVKILDQLAAEGAARVLGRINRKMSKLDAELGDTGTVGCFLLHAAKAIGATRFQVVLPEGESRWFLVRDYFTPWGAGALIDKLVAEKVNDFGASTWPPEVD